MKSLNMGFHFENVERKNNISFDKPKVTVKCKVLRLLLMYPSLLSIYNVTFNGGFHELVVTLPDILLFTATLKMKYCEENGNS